MCTWPSSPAIPAAPRNDGARFDHSTAQTRADDRGHRGSTNGVVSVVRVVRVQRCRIAVVAVHDGNAEARLQRAADVETPPLGQGEVGRALGRDHSVGRSRPGCVETDHAHGGTVEPGDLQGPLEGVGECHECSGRAFGDSAGHLDHPIDQELPSVVEHRDVVLRTTVVDTDDHGSRVAHVPPFEGE